MKDTRFPLHPGKVLTRSLQLGLSVTAYLAKTRTTMATKHLYEGGKGCKGIRVILNEGQEKYYNSKREGRPDASHLQLVERNIRRSHHKIVFNTSVSYGNIESKRMRRKEDRKYINNLADYYGAILRTLGAEEFQFPPPMKTYTDKGEVKWIYPGNARIPEFTPQHTAAELDFVDMIRPHGLELIRQCLKYSVPMRDVRRYLDELVQRLTPFLEQVYSEQRKIESGFVRGSVKVLREIVLEIRAKYGGTNGYPVSITLEVSHKMKERYMIESLRNSNFKDQCGSSIITNTKGSFNTNSKFPYLDSFFSDLADRCDIKSNRRWKKSVSKIRELTKNKILGRVDARYIMKDLLECSRKMGSSFHDFVTSAEFTTRPFTLSSVFRYGDDLVTEKSEFLIVCEVPIAEGRGRVDIILFRRKELHRIDDAFIEYIWEPCMAIEVKTRCFFNMDLYATFTKSKDRSRRVMEHMKELRKSDDDEWQQVIDATPIDYERGQLAAYEKEIIASYRQYAKRDLTPPIKLMKGVLVVDLKENWENLRDNIKELVVKAYHRSEEATLSKREHFHFNREEKHLRMGLVVFSNTEGKAGTTIKRVKYLDPFHYSKNRNDSREFILYHTVSGKGSPAQSAAQIAAHWHGLEILHERTKGTHRDILWFDLTGALATPGKRNRIFRATLQPSSIKRFLKRRVKFTDLSAALSSYLRGESTLVQVQQVIQSQLKRARRPFIVITGFDKLRDTTTREKIPLADRFLVQFLDDIPEHSTILWFDRPVPTTQTSQRYDTRSITPFYQGSPWMNLVGEIIYNVPTAPRRYGSYVPVEDDERWLVTEKNHDFTVTPLLIPPLYKWGERFRSDSARVENINRQNTYFLRSSSYSSQKRGIRREYDEDDEEALLELLPHLLRFYKEESRDSMEDEKEIIKRTVISKTPSSQQPFLSRVHFTPNQYLTEKEHDGRVTRLEPVTSINHRRQYRKSRLYGKPRKVTTQPPHIALLRYQSTGLHTIVSRELRGIKQVLKLIRKQYGEKKEWKEFLDSLQLLMDRKEPSDLFSPLRKVKILLKSHPLSQILWHQLSSIRTRLSQGLTPEQTQYLKSLTAQHPDLLLMTGNQLFLMLLAALHDADVLEPLRNVSEKLWQYLIPWQLMTIGYEPEYPPQHKTGVSVLQRSPLMDRLARRASALQDLSKNEDVYDVQFGKAFFVNERKNSLSLLLSFQTRPESHEMNVILLRLPSMEETLVDTLRGLCRERPFWGESDLIRLGIASDSIDVNTGMDIMVATKGGVRGLWVLDSEKTHWTSIGSLTYYSRPREQATLLMSLILQEEQELSNVSIQAVGQQGSYLQKIVEVGLGTVAAVFRKCKPMRCQVSLDTAEQMFRLSFFKVEGNEEIAHLLIKRTVDVLEILRRPDFQCQQVVVDEHEMIWNRFRDIDYMGDAKVLRPWVERREPFKTAELKLPPSAEQFIKMEKKVGMKLSISHDRGICPLCAVSQNEVKERIQKHSGNIKEYLQLVEGEQSQPDDLLNKSVYSHGLCWRVLLQAKGELPEVVRGLEDIALSGPSLATLLQTGALIYNENDRWVRHEFKIPQASSLPREFRESIILVEAYRDLVPRTLRDLQVPGSYLIERKESWIVSPNFQEEAVIWTAQSDTSGEIYRGQSFTVLVHSDESLEGATDRVINSIITTFPADSIRDFPTLQEHIRDMLRSNGHRSENLYGVEVDSKGNRVTFTVTKRKSGYARSEYGAVRVTEGMSLDDVFEQLKAAIDQKITAEEYELESPDELREALSDVLYKLVVAQGWAPPEEEPVEPILDPLTVALDHGRVTEKVKELRRTGKSQQVPRVIDGFLEKVRPALQDNPALISSFIDVVLLKVEVLVSGDLAGTIDPVMLLNVLDQIEKYSYHFEPRVLKSNTRFAKQVRWALELRESLMKNR
ncbi:MAG: hypothetical protein RTU63_15075 [Candidatus Thorarchaeota archaeon]